MTSLNLPDNVSDFPSENLVVVHEQERLQCSRSHEWEDKDLAHNDVHVDEARVAKERVVIDPSRVDREGADRNAKAWRNEEHVRGDVDQGESFRRHAKSSKCDTT